MDDVWLYVALDNPKAADRLIDKLFTAIKRIAKNPYLGRSRDEIIDGVRSYRVGAYVIFYLIDRHHIRIVRVLHGARDIDSVFEAP